MIKQIFLTPFQKFVKTESLAGMLLFGATIVALIWANSSYGLYYENLWQYKIGISFQDFELEKPLILWINDGLMAIFFFLIGLELKRELLIGEINTKKKATFPFVAALGGVLVPVGLYLVLNQNPETVKGWGIPMATDIAFALAILSTLGKRVPLSLKIFLTAFAIIDDIAAVLVIAVFYSASINWIFILFGIILIAFLGLLYYKKKYSFTIGIISAIIIWFLFLKSGVHPTIAGVLLAFTIPIKRRLNIKSFSSHLSSISNKIVNASDDDEKHLLTKDEMKCVDNLDELSFEVRSPLQHLEHKLHGLIAYFILPVTRWICSAGVPLLSECTTRTTSRSCRPPRRLTRVAPSSGACGARIPSAASTSSPPAAAPRVVTTSRCGRTPLRSILGQFPLTPTPPGVQGPGGPFFARVEARVRLT